MFHVITKHCLLVSNVANQVSQAEMLKEDLEKLETLSQEIFYLTKLGTL